MENDNALASRLTNLEQSLKSQLFPIAPDQDFVGTLQRQLQESPTYQQRRLKAATLLTIAGGLVIGLTIFLIGKQFLNFDRQG
jgi:hypothetical protein